jgi:hypothetical protein
VLHGAKDTRPHQRGQSGSNIKGSWRDRCKKGRMLAYTTAGTYDIMGSILLGLVLEEKTMGCFLLLYILQGVGVVEINGGKQER